MTLKEMKDKVREYMYIEDDSMIDIALACIIANRLKIGDPVWLMIIGASSSGKSQLLRPLAITDTQFIHRVDDITENTFLSGSIGKGGKDVSLLTRIGQHGMIAISDLTILFSRNAESRNAILSQLRMIYDGEMTKFVGNKDKPIYWKGYLGVISGGTPSIYSAFEEVADMGERFLCFRMKKYDTILAANKALNRKVYGKELDQILSELYGEYIENIVKGVSEVPELSEKTRDFIITISDFAERIRAINKIDKFTKEIERIPTPAMPMRTALQLSSLAKSLTIMRGRDLDDADMKIIAWVGFSLANEEKRAVLTILAHHINPISSQIVADEIGLDTKVTRSVLQNLASVGIIQRRGEGGSLKWIINEEYDQIIKEITGIQKIKHIEDREVTDEEYQGDSSIPF